MTNVFPLRDTPTRREKASKSLDIYNTYFQHQFSGHRFSIRDVELACPTISAHAVSGYVTHLKDRKQIELVGKAHRGRGGRLVNLYEIVDEIPCPTRGASAGGVKGRSCSKNAIDKALPIVEGEAPLIKHHPGFVGSWEKDDFVPEELSMRDELDALAQEALNLAIKIDNLRRKVA